MAQIIAGWASLLSNPPTEANYATHNARLDTYVVQKQKLLLVAHSQGNLFVNQAYDHVVGAATADAVKVVHIAPASPTLRGGHVLSSNDLIINALRVQGFQTVPPTNIDIPLSAADVTGHTLIETYLDPGRGGRSRVQSMINSAMQALKLPDTAHSASVGSFTVTLTWNGSGDVDLHIFEPGGGHVYYAALAGLVGYLDVDNVVANGPEHYYATCDPEKLLTGTYSVGINNFRFASGRTATIQVATAIDGVISTQTMDVGPEAGAAGNDSPINAVSVIVTKDPLTRAFKFVAL